MLGQGGDQQQNRVFCFVDLVDLIGIEKLLGVAEIDLLRTNTSNKSGSMCPSSFMCPRIFSDSVSVLPRL